jgi:transcriptional regulator with XRE-family HTH domain
MGGMHFQSIGNRIRKLRTERGLGQLELAQRAGIHNSRLSEFERGTRVPGDAHIEALARALGLEVDSVVRNTDWLSESQRAAVRSRSSRVAREFSRDFAYRPPCDRDMSTQLRKAIARYPEVVYRLVELIRAREDGELQMRMLGTVVAGSSLEAVVHAALLVVGVLVLVAPELLGFRKHPVVNPKTREGVGSQPVPAFRITACGRPCLLIPQVALACRKTTWTVDLLGAVIDPRGRVFWFYVEIDGEGHDPRSDRIKEEDIDLPIIRLSETDIVANTFLPQLEARISGLFALAA